MHAVRTRMTEAEYLAFENAAMEKHYYVNGEVVAMAGGTFAHAIVCGNAIHLLKRALRRGECRVSTSDLRVRIEDTGLYCYPDVTVVCEQPKMHPHPSRSLTNPTAIVEVLSPGTEADDRGWKWQHYRRIPSLKTYILIDPLTRLVEVHTRDDKRWYFHEAMGLEGTVAIPAFEIELPLAELFAGLDGLDANGDPLVVDE